MKTSSRKHLALAVAVLNCVAFPLLAPQDKAPVANPDSFTMNANTTLSLLAPGVLANDTDQDGDPLTAALASNVSHGALTFNANGSFNYTPANNFTGTDSFIYQASDGIAFSGNAIVTITVNAPVNHPPVVTNIKFNTGANTTFLGFFFPEFASDADGDLLTFRIIQMPSHGTLSFTSPARADYTPNSNFLGTDTFTYVANDGKEDSNVGTVSFIVLPVLSINNVSVLEGSFFSGNTATFTVTLSPPSSQKVTMDWKTETLTALASTDFITASGTLTFSPGDQHHTISVSTIPDRVLEPDEIFLVRLSSPTNAVVTDFQFGAGKCTILNDDPFIGVTEGIPPEALVKVGERFTYGIQWTHPVRWRLLDTVDIRIIDDEDSVLNVRFDEAANTFTLFNPVNGKFLHPDAPGSRTHFETDAAVMYLENSQVLGSGPTGPSVLLNLNLSFKPKAAGRVFRVEAFATDDDGNQQGFDEAGIIGVLRK